MEEQTGIETPGPDIPEDPEALHQFIVRREEQVSNLKPGTQATIEWAEPENKTPTDYAIVYLHGFKASREEGHPVHRWLAQALNCNLYLARLARHGLNDPDAFKDLQPHMLIESAVDALEIGRRLGKKIILIGTSTGASLGLYLGSKEKYRSILTTLVLYSPLIRFHGMQSFMLASRVGRSLLNIIPGPNYDISSPGSTKEEEKIWYSTYKLQGALALGTFIQHYMTNDTFKKVLCPVFAGYFYKNPGEQDKIVSVKAIKKMMKQLGTPERLKKSVNFPEAGTHVICNGFLSSSIKNLQVETLTFLHNSLEGNNL